MTNDDLYLSDIHLLCVTCRQPIKGTITTERWIKVEWISNEGECQGCHHKRKEAKRAQRHRANGLADGVL